ncbi:MAG: hypothetical protein EAZ62_09400, partial [Sphingobacteriia bacterium]
MRVQNIKVCFQHVEKSLMGWFLLVLVCCSIFSGSVGAQAVADSSVLGYGQWFKMGVLREGIYRLDLAFLNRLGFTGNSIPVQQIRLVGGRGAALPERNPSLSDQLSAQLPETALWIEDGGDGLLNGNDLVYFYAPGPHGWQRDSASGKYQWRLNPYSDTAFYFLTLNHTGAPPKRVQALPGSTTALGLPVLTQFSERWAWETDRINLLSSGQTWLGEAFG